MNAAPSRLPIIDGGINVARPGLDILLAVAKMRQASLPTVRMAYMRARSDAHRARVQDVILVACGQSEHKAHVSASVRPSPYRFFDLSDDALPCSEPVNGLFTRGFQAMLSPCALQTEMSDVPTPPDVETME